MQIKADFTHVQEVPATTWVINHPLHCHPTVSCKIIYEGEWHDILPKDIRYVSEDQVAVDWSVPRVGKARLV